jgi:hypothetical protein
MTKLFEAKVTSQIQKLPHFKEEKSQKSVVFYKPNKSLEDSSLETQTSMRRVNL